MAYHVLDVISQLMKSSELGQMVRVESTCEQPAALTQEDLNRLIR